MTFRVHARLISAATAKARPKEARDDSKLRALRERAAKEKQDRHELICRACQFFLSEIERCMHPNCGCPRSDARAKPWKKLRRCPVKNWP